MERIKISAEHMANLVNLGRSPQEIAETYGYSESGVRGMISKYLSKPVEGEDEPVDTLKVWTPRSPSEERVHALIERGSNRLDNFLANKRPVRFLFTSDHHWPYQDNRCISLNLKIIELFQPGIITGLNDFFDFAEYSRWDNISTPASELWGSDIQRPLDLHGNWWKNVNQRLERPDETLRVGLWGNHDLWLWQHLMSKASGYGVYTLANVLEEMEGHGLVIPSWPDRKHTIKVSPRLKFIHGFTASKNPGTVAKNTLEYTAGKAYEEDAGHFYTTVYGHDHRSTVYDYYGVTAYGAGMNCIVNMPYLNAPPDWQPGVVIGTVNPQTRELSATRIRFEPDGKQLYCYVLGQRLSS